jgi:hypothetical protein
MSVSIEPLADCGSYTSSFFIFIAATHAAQLAIKIGAVPSTGPCEIFASQFPPR